MSYDKEPSLQEEIRKMQQESVEPAKEATSQEVQDTSTSEVVPEISEAEKQARALGWKSKEERVAEGKDNQHYVEPEEYVRRQPLFERIERQNKEVRELKERQRQYDQNLAQVRRESYEQALRDLEDKRERAVEEANSIEFRRLDAQHRQLNQQMQQDPIVNRPQTPEINQEVLDFANKNSTWYNDSTIENAKMKTIADATDQALTRVAKLDNRQVNVREHLASIESEVKRLFPHRFEQPKTTTTTPVPTVGKSTSVNRDTKFSTNLVAKLTQQQRELGDKFVKSNKDYTLEQYATELERMGRLGK